jgi:hypothetical protein
MDLEAFVTDLHGYWTYTGAAKSSLLSAPATLAATTLLLRGGNSLWLQPLLRSINAIAAGMRNTG